ncbi:hypothetical protein PoB_005225100 [Plakobranchus ocellatus]|uniref:Uncharacterized protein n=1 Tax=Plakobranchus ocellatus TaxID=259542 RepID=A0AAV4BYX7_9GAST|nr:hypothetical protein PoB_005225100 [Plakobranchus ocellatus]
MKLCFKCLSTKHSARSCQKTCFFCRGPHHSTLHRHRDQLSAGGPAQFGDSKHPVQQHPRDRHQLGSPNSPPFISGSYIAAGTHLPAPSQNLTDTHHACYSQSSALGKSILCSGVGYYHELMGRQSVHAGNGLVAQETKLDGWFLEAIRVSGLQRKMLKRHYLAVATSLLRKTLEDCGSWTPLGF